MGSYMSRMRTSTKARHFMTVSSRQKDSGNGASERFRWRGALGSVVETAVVEEEDSIKAALTETQGLELVLGVGERCTVTSAIQRPGSGHLRGSDSGETSIIVLSWRKPSRTRVVGPLSFFLPLPRRS